MKQEKLNTASEMKELKIGEIQKEYGSSSHYRNMSAMATKFVTWSVEPLESLCDIKVYLLREKLYRGERMTREEKNWLCEAVNSNTYFRTVYH